MDQTETLKAVLSEVARWPEPLREDFHDFVEMFQEHEGMTGEAAMLRALEVLRYQLRLEPFPTH